MKVDTGALVEHLKLVSMNGRISEIAFGEGLAVELIDTDEEVAVRGKSKIELVEGFALSDAMDFRKIVKAFKGEIDLEVGAKLKITTEAGVINYQIADAATIESTLKNFDAIEKANFDGPTIIASMSATTLDNLRRFLKLLTPDIVELSAVQNGEKWDLEAELINADGHDAMIIAAEADVPDKIKPKYTETVVDIGTAVCPNCKGAGFTLQPVDPNNEEGDLQAANCPKCGATAKVKTETAREVEAAPPKDYIPRTKPLKISAKAVQDVIDGIELNVDEQLALGICGALRIHYRDYEFIISKQVEV